MPFAVALVFSVLALQAPAQDGPRAYTAVYDAFRRMAPAPNRAARVSDLTLRRDRATFHLGNGTLYLLTPVEGQIIGADFVGSGGVSSVPPSAIEQPHLRRIIGDLGVTGPFTSAVFLFADSTMDELLPRLRFDTAPPAAPAVGGRIGDALAFFNDDYQKAIDETLMAALLAGRPNGYFAAYIERARGEALVIKIDPYQVEEVMLLRKGKLTRQRVQLVSQFQSMADLADTAKLRAARDERPEPLRLDSYTIDATIANDLDFSASATVRLAAKQDTVRWTRLYLF